MSVYGFDFIRLERLMLSDMVIFISLILVEDVPSLSSELEFSPF